MKLFGLVLGTVLTIAAQCAHAEGKNVTLVSRDGSLTLQVTLISYEHQAFFVDTAVGELVFLEREMICFGDACPKDQDSTNAVLLQAKQ